MQKLINFNARTVIKIIIKIQGVLVIKENNFSKFLKSSTKTSGTFFFFFLKNIMNQKQRLKKKKKRKKNVKEKR